jgi:hypothetical protein
VSGSTLQWLTFVAATIAAVGSLVRVYQNERSYRLMRKMHKKSKRKK